MPWTSPCHHAQGAPPWQNVPPVPTVACNKTTGPQGRGHHHPLGIGHWVRASVNLVSHILCPTPCQGHHIDILLITPGLAFTLGCPLASVARPWAPWRHRCARCTRSWPVASSLPLIPLARTQARVEAGLRVSACTHCPLADGPPRANRRALPAHPVTGVAGPRRPRPSPRPVATTDQPWRARSLGAACKSMAPLMSSSRWTLPRVLAVRTPAPALAWAGWRCPSRRSTPS